MTTTRAIVLSITDPEDFQGGFPEAWDWDYLVGQPLGVTVAAPGCDAELWQAVAAIDDPYDPDEVEEQGDTDNPLADYWATLAMALAAAVKRCLDGDGAGGFTCAECGTADAETYVVTGAYDDKEGRTEVCMPCHDALED